LFNFTAIAAIDNQRGLAKEGKIPWFLTKDMKFFRNTTSLLTDQAAALAGKKNVVFMGRKTWDTIPLKFRPLPDRLNVVISSQDAQFDGATTVVPPTAGPSSMDMTACGQVLSICADLPFVDKVFCIGGARLYTEAVQHPACEELILTRIDHNFDCDLFFPEYEHSFKLVQVLQEEQQGHCFRMERWRR